MPKLIIGVVVTALLAVTAFARKAESNDLPLLIRDAIKVMPDGEKLDPGQVIVISNVELLSKQLSQQWLEQRARARSITPEFLDEYEKKLATLDERLPLAPAFVFHNQFPIYINANAPDFGQATTEYEAGRSQWAYWYAAILAHERMHALGETEELPAYEHQLDVLKLYEKGNFLRGFEAAVKRVEMMVLRREEQQRIVLPDE
jgi:hypothetical protein